MNTPVKTVKVVSGRKAYTVSVYYEINPEDPREGFDNLGHMACAHRRYKLGDEQLNSRDDIHTWEQVEAMLRKERGAHIILPLYLYDHSALAISTVPWQGRAPHADWDSGQVGFIFVTKDRLVKEYGTSRASMDLVRMVTNILKGEVETYDHYLRGEAYGYDVTDSKGEHVGSCWGYYSIEAAAEAAKESLP